MPEKKYGTYTYDHVLREINKIPMFGTAGAGAMDYSLDRMKRWSRRLDHPEQSFTTIHVAGTNGKGTTCRMIASVYQTAGYRTGLYTSPHLLDLRERVRVDAKKISKKAIIEFYSTYHMMLSEDPPTYFEWMTLLAFWYFRRKNVQIAAIETGLGGRLDATNIIKPAVSVITSIGMDHKEILGETLQAIASEKAGIIKSHTPVIIGLMKPDAAEVLQNHALERSAPVFFAGLDEGQEGEDQKCDRGIDQEGEDLQLEGDEKEVIVETMKKAESKNKNAADSFSGMMRPPTDRLNRMTTRSAIRILSNRFPVSADEISEGLASWPLRYKPHGNFEPLMPGKNWYFSGAHNPEAWKDLTEHLQTIAPARHWTVVLSMLSDKCTIEVQQSFKPFEHLMLVPMDTPRAASMHQMKSLLPWGRLIPSLDALVADAQGTLVDTGQHANLNAPDTTHQCSQPESRSWKTSATPSQRSQPALPGSGKSDHQPGFGGHQPDEKERTGLVIFTGSLYFYNTVERWVQSNQTTISRG